MAIGHGGGRSYPFTLFLTETDKDGYATPTLARPRPPRSVFSLPSAMIQPTASYPAMPAIKRHTTYV